MRSSTAFLPLFIVYLLLAGCSGKPTAVIPVAAADQVAGNWLLVNPASPYQVTLKITPALAPIAGHFGLAITGQSSVNAYSATGIFSTGPSIDSGEAGTGQFTGLGSTERAGLPEPTQFEEDYFSWLRTVNRLEITRTGQLRLSYAGPSPGTLLYKRH